MGLKLSPYLTFCVIYEVLLILSAARITQKVFRLRYVLFSRRVLGFDRNMNFLSLHSSSNSENHSNGLRTFICTVSERSLRRIQNFSLQYLILDSYITKLQPKIHSNFLLSAKYLHSFLPSPAFRPLFSRLI